MATPWRQSLLSVPWIGVGLASAAQAEIPGLVWEPSRIVDQPVTEMSSTSGPSMVFAGGRRHIV